MNCESLLQGTYCAKCGEKVLTEQDRSIKAMIGEWLGSIWNLDNKMVRSLKVLLSQPGELSRLFILGNRKRYIRPIQLFLIVNLIYFLFPMVNSLNTPFKTQMQGLPYSGLLKPKIEKIIVESGMEYAVFEQKFNQTSQNIGNLIVIILAPFFGLLFSLLHFKEKKYFFTDFLAISLYFLTFFILVFFANLSYCNAFYFLCPKSAFEFLF